MGNYAKKQSMLMLLSFENRILKTLCSHTDVEHIDQVCKRSEIVKKTVLYN